MSPTSRERRSSPLPPRLAQTKRGLRRATTDRGLDGISAAEDGIAAAAAPMSFPRDAVVPKRATPKRPTQKHPNCRSHPRPLTCRNTHRRTHPGPHPQPGSPPEQTQPLRGRIAYAAPKARTRRARRGRQPGLRKIPAPIDTPQHPTSNATRTALPPRPTSSSADSAQDRLPRTHTMTRRNYETPTETGTPEQEETFGARTRPPTRPPQTNAKLADERKPSRRGHLTHRECSVSAGQTSR